MITCCNKAEGIELKSLNIKKEENVIIVIGDDKGLSNNIVKIAKHNINIKPQNNASLFNKYPYTIVNNMNSSVICSLLLNHIKS